MPLPSRRDREELRRRLATWLATKLPPGASPEISALSIPETNGLSSETLIFDAAWNDGGARRTQKYVARMSPEMTDYPVFPSYDLALQYRCLRLVGEHTDVPVPRAPWLETDEAHLGSAFFVMEHVPGIVPPDMPPYIFGSWLTEASPAERARLERASIEVLAQLHGLDVSQADVGFLDRPEYGKTPLDQHLGYQRWYYEWAKGDEDFPIIERTFDWLAAHRPTEPERTVVNWGDARIGNMLYRDFAPVAVLDWEMATLGAPEVDLAWMLVIHRFFADLIVGTDMPGTPGFLERDTVAKTYAELAGRPPTNLAFYEVFAALRYGIVMIRTSTRMIAAGDMPAPAEPEQKVMNRGMLEKMLDGSYWA